MASSLGVDVSVTDINRSHRVGRPGKTDGKPHDILVKFTSYRVRRNLFQSKSKAKAHQNYRGVYINEDLTRLRTQLMSQARVLVKSKRIFGCWSSDGTVLVKDLKVPGP